MRDISAELTLRVARFIQMPETPPASPARWFFVPEFYSAQWDEALALLTAAPKPLIIAPLPDPGFLGSWYVGALTGVHRERVDHQLQNQQAFFSRQLDGLGLTDADTIVFDSGADETAIEVSAFRCWLRDYTVCAGSTLHRHATAPRTAALLVRRPHGGWSPGMTCDHRPATS